MIPTTESPMTIVILGCGRVGSTLARQLAAEGHAITIIDLTNDAFRRLGTKFKGHRVVGTGLDQDTLNKAHIANADTFIAVTQGDNTNIMAAQIAKEVYSIKNVIARIYDPIRAQAYREMGIKTLCTTTLAAGLIRSIVTDAPDTAVWQKTMEQWDKAYLEQVG